ncbi:MAG: hypothetical protein A3K83_03545 [Omnitrophica WOR_2 bacterium RBG_13_44_8b]|nr:MAG: hypothetical protein A3K83_03545 [Omnitrophica WOR_2 bacterium RBG_13_44_8b]
MYIIILRKFHTLMKIFLGLIFFIFITKASLFAWEPTEMIIVFRRGEQFYEQGRYKEAIIEYEKVLDMSPDNKIALERKREAEDKLRSQGVLEARREKERQLWQQQEQIQEKLSKLRQQRYKREFEREIKDELQMEASQFKETRKLQEELLGQKLKNMAALERIKIEQERMEIDRLLAEQAERLKKLGEAQRQAFLRAEAESISLPIKGFREEGPRSLNYR